MKTLLMSLILSLGVSVEASQVSACVAKVGPSFGATNVVINKVAPGFYAVSHFGNSRNNYAAVYKVINGTQTRLGQISYLMKVQDNSTHKNMPQNLTLEKFLTSHSQSIPSDYAVLSGLFGHSVVFKFGNCIQL